MVLSQEGKRSFFFMLHFVSLLLNKRLFSTRCDGQETGCVNIVSQLTEASFLSLYAVIEMSTYYKTTFDLE